MCSSDLYGVEPEGADSMSRSLRSGQPEKLEKVSTVADSLGAPFALPYSFGVCQRFVDDVVRVLIANSSKAKSLVKGLVPLLANSKGTCDQRCHHALDSAIITAPAARDPAVVTKLQPIVGRVLG